ncbi:aldo/keto reductase [Isoptericola sp. 4D.3]|uniref:Aldo/keto reductase n=1 Tax=Isoptericola peretonis TaxID=2918523 RepID=A0ABT0J7H4_9MICO|nr:aldo/keto reductase [Isoptericola sp. 4D.3]
MTSTTRLRRLGRTDIEISPIGLGCMQMGGRGMIERVFPVMPQETATAVVRAALDGGITWLDTAEMYGRGQSERTLSTALRDLGVPPGAVRVATKWSPLGRTAGSIGRTFGDRVAALQGYPVDLHQIHMPYALSSLDAQVDAMADLADAGLVGSIGVSNFGAARLERAALRLAARGHTLASNQVQINLLHRDVETNGVLRVAQEHGITLIGYSPLRQGLLTGRFHEDPAVFAALPPLRRLVIGGRRTLERTAPLVRELTAIAAAHGVTPAAVALAWVITHYGETVVCIPGASGPRQAAANAEVMALRLTAGEVAALDERSRA